jgi:anti-sigma regulatory factor (Ser/Thr protein kinase)
MSNVNSQYFIAKTLASERFSHNNQETRSLRFEVAPRMSVPLGTPDLPSQVLREQCQLTLPSQPHWIQPAVEYLQKKALLAGAVHEARAGKLLLALHEALSNAVIHGNLEISSSLKEDDDDAFIRALAERSADPVLASRVVEVVVDYDGDACRWIITDQGKGFAVDDMLRNADSDNPEVMLSSGRGIAMMRALVDDLRYELNGRRVILTMRRCEGEEQRLESRLPMHQPLRVAPLLEDGVVDWDHAVNAISRNFSNSGLALLRDDGAVSRHVVVGLWINDEMLYLPAEVRRIRHLSGGVVELGCQFLASLSAELARNEPEIDAHLAEVHRAIAAILEARRKPYLSHGERRHYPRMGFTERIEIHADSLKGPVIGFARDVSKGGIAFLSQTPMPRHIAVVFQPTADTPVLRVQCEVIRCSLVRADFYDIGARFIRLSD